jgi:hypothetical protein
MTHDSTPTPALKLVTAGSSAEYMELAHQVTKEAWPEFMNHDPIANKQFHRLYEDFADYQFILADTATGDLAVVGNSIPLAWKGKLEDLPDQGWDWAIRQGADDLDNGRQPAIQCALQVAIKNEYRDKHFASYALSVMKQAGAKHGLQGLIAPVRPNLKTAYPLQSADDYVRWRRDDGLPLDHWMRVHVRAGARVIKVCPNSMSIEGTVADWELWTAMKFPQSDEYVIPGALSPVRIDLERNLGTYVEPNVWMYHPPVD